MLQEPFISFHFVIDVWAAGGFRKEGQMALGEAVR